MKSRTKSIFWIFGTLAVIVVVAGLAVNAAFPAPKRLLARTLFKLTAVANPAGHGQGPVLAGHVAVVEAGGPMKDLAGQEADFAFQAPDRLYFTAEVEKHRLEVGRDGQELWIHAPEKKFGVVGKPGVARFAAAPDKLDDTKLPAWRLPISKWMVVLAVLSANVAQLPETTVGGAPCSVLKVSLPAAVAEAAKAPDGILQLSLRKSDLLPARIRWQDKRSGTLEAELRDLSLGAAKTRKWDLAQGKDEKVETVALSHLVRFFPAVLSLLNQNIPTLGPAKGERKVVATEGQGRLEVIDDTRVLFLKGSPAEMGRQHGTLLRSGVRDLVSRVLYGVGVGSSFEKGRWFFGEIERAQARVQRFVDPRYLEEMDAMAVAAGLEPQEIRLSNFFPELFHCSGFALFGKATEGGHMYHGRILDYMRGVGMEPNAVVIVNQPDYGHAWVNISYAGFVGSVTAMNEKHISIGEMGGRGEGLWDGKPMAELVREVMEKASTLDEAIDIMRRGPRTCEYYYVISDGNNHTAVGIAATPDKFEVVLPGKAHPLLPHPFEDAVLMSAGDRYEKLAERVGQGYGKFNEESARHLMDRPVCMTSNIHSVLFEPDTLDFWVANADAKNVASHTRYTHYNLAELLGHPSKSGAPVSKTPAATQPQAAATATGASGS